MQKGLGKEINGIALTKYLKVVFKKNLKISPGQSDMILRKLVSNHPHA